MCKTIDDLLDFFRANYQLKDTLPAKRRLLSGLLISTELRKQFMTGEHQGRIILGGIIRPLETESLGGGVWRVYYDLDLE